MKDIAVVMVTVDRSPSKNYLGDTLANLARAGVDRSSRFHSLAIADSDDSEPRHSANRNVAVALRVGAKSGAPWVLFLEDDIDVCNKFLDGVGAWLDEHASEKYPIYSFGAAYDVVDSLHARGETSWRYPVEAFYGTQAFAIRAADAATLAAWLEAHEFALNHTGTAYDIHMHHWAEARDAKYFLASVPAFVQHVGKESVVAPRPESEIHTFKSWPGREWAYQPVHA